MRLSSRYTDLSFLMIPNQLTTAQGNPFLLQACQKLKVFISLRLGSTVPFSSYISGDLGARVTAKKLGLIVCSAQLLYHFHFDTDHPALKDLTKPRTWSEEQTWRGGSINFLKCGILAAANTEMFQSKDYHFRRLFWARCFSAAPAHFLRFLFFQCNILDFQQLAETEAWCVPLKEIVVDACERIFLNRDLLHPDGRVKLAARCNEKVSWPIRDRWPKWQLEMCGIPMKGL
ncbi:hypothetical protein MMC10_007127 [Thelotrema lepadinum]|nr:hypothetical protein [Thelotrema lepadinum]